MRKPIILLLLLAVVGGAGYYVYTHGLRLPGWIRSLSSADAQTTSNVQKSLNLSKRVSGFNIGVQTSGGVVTLTGQVPSEDLKSLAAAIARDTEGVKEVKNEIAVDPGAQPTSESIRVEDLEIRASLLEAFARSPELGGQGIDVKVENRIVTLSGSVDTPAQSRGAEQTARSLDSVAGVTNNLAVKNPQAATEPPATNAPARDPNAELAERVEFELYRTKAFDTLKMNIKAKDGAINLSGTVRSRAEQLLAERIVQSLPGVKSVVNELKVAEPPAPR